MAKNRKGVYLRGLIRYRKRKMMSKVEGGGGGGVEGFKKWGGWFSNGEIDTPLRTTVYQIQLSVKKMAIAAIKMRWQKWHYNTFLIKTWHFSPNKQNCSKYIRSQGFKEILNSYCKNKISNWFAKYYFIVFVKTKLYELQQGAN